MNRLLACKGDGKWGVGKWPGRGATRGVRSGIGGGEFPGGPDASCAGRHPDTADGVWATPRAASAG